jgi:AcrR family transcriptional regulator
MDPRMSRSRAKLADAVLRLAAERDVPTLTVAEISAEAGVNRSTFYQHAPSPAALLCTVLATELDAIRERHLAAADGDIRAALGKVTLAVMEHVQDHWDVYRRGLAGSGEAPGLQAMLGSHFEASARLVFESRRVRVPRRAGRPVPVAMAARFIAYGVVGAIEAWVLEDEPEQAAEVAADLQALLPGWWPLA